MTSPADLILTNAAVHPLSTPSSGEIPPPEAEAIAIRDGRIVRVDTSYEVSFLAGIETDVIDLEGRPLLPGFVDAHTHLDFIGQRLTEADLGACASREECLETLRTRRDETDGDVVLGFAYDESQWGEQPDRANHDRTYLTRDDLDTVSTERPVCAFREDMHLASLNSVAMERYGDEFPPGTVHTAGGKPTGVVVEEAVSILVESIGPDREGLRENLLRAQEYAHSKGVTAIHDMVSPETARAYRELDEAGNLTLRVRLNYYDDHVDAVIGAGLTTNFGSDRVRTGAIKTFVDGSIGGRTARLTESYHDSDGEERGEWVTEPGELRDLIERVERAGMQLAVHAIGNEAISAVIESFEHSEGDRSGPDSDHRHRIEHAEVCTADVIDRLAASDLVVSGQPNFLKWARSGGLYESRLGDARRRESNPFGTLHDSGTRLAFGSDGMPLDPLFGIDQVVTAPEPAQRLDVTEALRAYTLGGATAGFDEDRTGTIERGKCADLVVLSESPWESDSIADIDVDLTVANGEIVYRA